MSSQNISRKPRQAIPKKMKKKNPQQLQFKDLILPQYHQFIDSYFFNNNLPLNVSSIERKDKLKDINSMLEASKQKPKVSEEGNQEFSQLKNENTKSWLKKRYYQSSNQKYLGNEEDLLQQNFLKLLFQTITKHLKSKTIFLQDFHRLLVSFDLPMLLPVLQKIYQIVDEDKDGALNFEEFQSLNLNDRINLLYLEQLKLKSKQFAQMPVKPASLSALCLFVAFRINHDFLTEFLYDSNFKVKDKSQGLQQMLDLIKMQGEIKIKSNFDKKIIRKLNLNNFSAFGFMSPTSKKIQIQEEHEIEDSDKNNIVPKEIKETLLITPFIDSATSITYSKNITSRIFTKRPSYDSHQESSEFILNKKQSQNQTGSKDMVEKESTFNTTLKSKQQQAVLSSRSERNLQNYIKENQHQERNQSLEIRKKVGSQFDLFLQNIIGKANQKGQQTARYSYFEKQDILKEIQSLKSPSSRTKIDILPKLQIVSPNKNQLINFSSDSAKNISDRSHSLLFWEGQGRDIDESSQSNQSLFSIQTAKKYGSKFDIFKKEKNYPKSSLHFMESAVQKLKINKQNDSKYELMPLNQIKPEGKINLILPSSYQYKLVSNLQSPCSQQLIQN